MTTLVPSEVQLTVILVSSKRSPVDWVASEPSYNFIVTVAEPLEPAAGMLSKLKLITGDLPELESEETMLAKFVWSIVPPIRLAFKVVPVNEV